MTARHIFSVGTYLSKCSAEHFDRLGKVEVHTHLPPDGDRPLVHACLTRRMGRDAGAATASDKAGRAIR
jgi:hypothetical protein